jgi:hypothetical protein
MTEEKKDDKPKFDKKRMAPRHRREAIELWERGEVTIDDLSKRYNKHPDTFRRLFRENGVEKGSKAKKFEEKVAEKVEKQLSDDAIETANRIKETRDGSYRMLKAIQALVSHEIRKAQEENRSLATTEKTMKALKLSAETVEITRRGRFDILGLNKDDYDDEEVPDLEVRELTDEEIRRRMAAAEAEMEDEDDLDVVESNIKKGITGGPPSPDDEEKGKGTEQ